MDHQKRIKKIVIAYPFAILLVAIVLNLFLFDVSQSVPSLPSGQLLWALSVSGALLVINHTWLMTSTELIRVRYGMRTTPEEWKDAGRTPDDIEPAGFVELERRHNAHRNTSENTIYFVFLALIFSAISPSAGAAYTWILGYPAARLGYTYAYLVGNDGLRGLFMTASLLALYGMASYLLISSFLLAN